AASRRTCRDRRGATAPRSAARSDGAARAAPPRGSPAAHGSTENRARRPPPAAPPVPDIDSARAASPRAAAAPAGSTRRLAALTPLRDLVDDRRALGDRLGHVVRACLREPPRRRRHARRELGARQRPLLVGGEPELVARSAEPDRPHPGRESL